MSPFGKNKRLKTGWVDILKYGVCAKWFKYIQYTTLQYNNPNSHVD